jgi:hypothetical protein
MPCLSTGANTFVPMFDSESGANESDVQQALPMAGKLSGMRVRLDGIAGPAGSGDAYGRRRCGRSLHDWCGPIVASQTVGPQPPLDGSILRAVIGRVQGEDSQGAR